MKNILYLYFVENMNKKQMITLTFGEQAENHKGMEMIGNGLVKEGLTLKDLKHAKKLFEKKGYVCELHKLNEESYTTFKLEDAYILIIKNGIHALTSEEPDNLMKEQLSLKWDTKAYMYGRVVNKKARHNLCYSDIEQQPDYENGKGTIVKWDTIPITKKLRENLKEYFGVKAEKLQCEGNHYYDITKCGISFHGDSERRIVIACRLGHSLPIHYQWFYNLKPIGSRMIFNLDHGDVYAMSSKAVGTDWKRRTIPTLRHATGCKKYTTIKEK